MTTKRARGRPEVGAINHLNIPAGLVERIQEFADNEFMERAEAARTLIEVGLAHSGVSPRVLTPAERLKEANAAMKEDALRKSRHELCEVQFVVDLVLRAATVMKSRIDALPQAIPGLTADQMAAMKMAVADCYSDFVALDPKVEIEEHD